jgi:hypothetical protein
LLLADLELLVPRLPEDSTVVAKLERVQTMKDPAVAPVTFD